MMLVGVGVIAGWALWFLSNLGHPDPTPSAPTSRGEIFQQFLAVRPGSPLVTDVTVTVVPGNKPALAKLFLLADGAHVSMVKDRSGEVVPIRSQFGRYESGENDLLSFACSPVDTCARTYTVTFEADGAYSFEGLVFVRSYILYDGPAPADSSVHTTVAAGERMRPTR